MVYQSTQDDSALRAAYSALTERVRNAEAENERLRAALKVHHDLGLWSLGHETCPECGQAC